MSSMDKCIGKSFIVLNIHKGSSGNSYAGLKTREITGGNFYFDFREICLDKDYKKPKWAKAKF